MHTMICLALAAHVGGDDTAKIRDNSAQYSAMVLKSNKAGLGGLLHNEYQGFLPGVWGGEKRTKAESVAFWTNPRSPFLYLRMSTESVRLFGTTAIERGKMFGEQKDPLRFTHTYGGVGFTRV